MVLLLGQPEAEARAQIESEVRQQDRREVLYNKSICRVLFEGVVVKENDSCSHYEGEHNTDHVESPIPEEAVVLSEVREVIPQNVGRWEGLLYSPVYDSKLLSFLIVH